MVKIEGSGAVIRRLRQLAKMHGSPQVVVGYTMYYAVYVHENMNANHPNGGQAKFLEQPAKEMRKELGQIVAKAMKKGAKLETALLKAGMALQARSQELVPVDTGALRASAFTEIKR